MGREDPFFRCRLPISRACAGLVNFVGFPVRRVVFLLSFLSWRDQDGEGAVGVVRIFFLIDMLLRVVLRAYRIAGYERRIVRDWLVVVGHSFKCFAQPARGRQGAGPPFVALAFRSAGFTVAAGRNEIDPPFFVKTIVANGGRGNVFIRSFLLWFIRGFSCVVVRTDGRTNGLHVNICQQVVS